ncbi:MAG: DUF1501 domain-containing protein [Planctomycetota bacterium]|nr:DUF1501 domain-containing protein [Planctomycetota bacterium]
MLEFLDTASRTTLCDRLDRRVWLRLGASFGGALSGFPGLGLAAKKPAGPAKTVIVLFHLGGPPQHETWDPKPDAPLEIRGPFGTLATATPGYRVGELMPRTAALTRHIAVLRALSTNDNAHSSSGYWMLTGVPHQPTNVENAKLGAPNDSPSMGALLRSVRQGPGGMPGSVTLPEHIWNTGGIPWPGQDGGFMGRGVDPWLLPCMPHDPSFAVGGVSLPAEVPVDRLDNRAALARSLDRVEGSLERLAPALWGERAAQVETALNLVRSGAARQAFRLEEEPESLRDRYGRNRFGQSVLLARRLAQAGVPFVQVNWCRMPGDTDDSPAWDTHNKNAQRLKSPLMPIMDAAYSALLEDLEQRGMLDQTLVVWCGEFGRTPRYNPGGGRDHWGHVFSAALAGGGIRGGVVHGSSDRQGGHPKDGRVEPQDMWATVCHCVGVEPETEIRDPQNRPFPLSRGSVISPVVA